MNHPLEYISGQDGISTESFDYFPEAHYRQGFEQLRSTVSETELAEWMDRVLDRHPDGGSRGRLAEDEVPELVSDILSSSERFEAEISIRPRAASDGLDYHVEWQYIDFDIDDYRWKPINEITKNSI